MVDAVILLLVLIVMIFAVKGSIRHFRGEGPCCGGGSTPVAEVNKKLDRPVIGETVIRIGGMHCEHCRQNVAGALNRIDGVSAKVDIKKGQAVVAYDRAVDAAVLKKAVEDAGYTVVSIQ